MTTSLRRKILLYSSSVLIALIAAMLVFVSYQAGRFVDAGIRSELQDGRSRIKSAEEARIRNLKLTANLVASLPSFVSALGTDTATVRDFLLDYQQRTSTELLLALDPAGHVVARTDTPDLSPVPTGIDSGILQSAGATYHFAKMPADATGTLYGYVIAGALVDDKFARSLHDSTNGEVVISGARILGSTVARSALAWQTEADWERVVGKDSDPRIVEIGGERYEAAATRLGTENGPRVLAAVLKSYDGAMRPYRGIQLGLLVLGIVAAIAGIAISAVLARTITAPVAKLVEGTRQVAAGNFDYRLDVRSTDEIGGLARSFNTMIQGLRERADMQKFVSLSTIEMIQSAATKKVSAGEKVVLTVLFSDMRGFTTMTENRTPEETVKLLNSALSLQAQRVKKFHGDIDKYVGDCVVALFQGEDMELNAIRCALEMHRALEELNAANPDALPIRVGIGIVTGEVILGSIGSEDRLDYTAIGSNVNLCSRLCSQAGPGETLIAESTYQRLNGLVAAQKLAPLHVKGFSDPVAVYRMTL
ncbi:MAG TPA: adenylate/guanylate cyclase domain-containing protein [Terriglobia bacterium]|nr:adenylate/guanylate cyclase domain-containing protein [Terriglobia bacterium]